MKWVKKVRNPISQIFCTICQIPAQRIFLTAKPSTDLPPKIGGKNTKCSFSRQEIETFHNVGSKIICLKVISYVTVESVSIKSGFFVPDKDIWKVKPWLKGKGRSLKASWWKKVLSRPHPSDPESSVALLMHPSAKVTVTFLFGMQSKVYQWWGHPDVRFFTSQFKMKNIHTFFYMFPLKSPRKSCTLSLNSASRGSSD